MKRRLEMSRYMKYALLAVLALFVASCAPKKWEPPREKPGAEVGRELEERFKSETAVNRVPIGDTGAAFYYDKRMWNVRREDEGRIDFSTRRFTNASILYDNRSMPMTRIYASLVDAYDLKNASLLESEFVRVNGDEVIFNKIQGKYGRKSVVMLSYGYSEQGRTVIAHAYIYKGMLRPETEREIIEFLNGLVARD